MAIVPNVCDVALQLVLYWLFLSILDMRGTWFVNYASYIVTVFKKNLLTAHSH